ncbi:unnamed protein product [Dicrocoelium dendriticum]|nr:unnamed protein product [Dicrocoelium dendriticum]
MSDDSVPVIELFVRAAPSSRSDREPGLVGQQWIMVLRMLEQKHLIHLRIVPTSFDNPPANYKSLGSARLLPIAWIESGQLNGADAKGTVISSSGGLEVLMAKLGCANLDPSLKEEDVRAAERISQDLYSDLMHYIKNNNSKRLLVGLKNLNEYLASSPGHYMLGDQISYVDCQLMPKLQHIRVAGGAYKQFDIPEDLSYVWEYISRMYQSEVFLFSCPTDRDMLMHYDEKDPLPKEIRPGLLGPEILRDIPSGVHRPREDGDTSG